MIKVTLDHGSTTTLEQGATVAQAFEALGLAKDAPGGGSPDQRGSGGPVPAALGPIAPSPPSAWTAPRVWRSCAIPPPT